MNMVVTIPIPQLSKWAPTLRKTAFRTLTNFQEKSFSISKHTAKNMRRVATTTPTATASTDDEKLTWKESGLTIYLSDRNEYPHWRFTSLRP